MSNSPHVLVLSFPVQGHVNPLMTLSEKLAKNGFKITFVNTDFTHKRVVSAVNDHFSPERLPVNLVSIPDGLGPEEDRNDLAKLCLAILNTMPSVLEKLIKDINADDDEGSNKITCIVADANMGWALEVGHKMGIKGAALWPASAAVFALEDNMPKLVEDGIMDSNGFPLVKGQFRLSPHMPIMATAHIPWCCICDLTSQKIMYNYISQMIKPLNQTDWCLCNTATELEPEALSLSPKLLPIGPLTVDFEDFESKRSLGQFWEEDLSCLSWLDEQPPCSVIYIAFGSITVFEPNQFKELALRLDLTNRPFLWVVKEDPNGGSKMAYPDEFRGKNGKIVSWAPQKKVLSHPAIACFISHCGWNSTIEGLSNGVPFLCWPYFADQFFDKAYICDVWKLGLGLDFDEEGKILSGEIKEKVEQLLEDEDIRERSKKLKDMLRDNIAEGGQSSENFCRFVKWLKE